MFISRLLALWVGHAMDPSEVLLDLAGRLLKQVPGGKVSRGALSRSWGQWYLGKPWETWGNSRRLLEQVPDSKASRSEGLTKNEDRGVAPGEVPDGCAPLGTVLKGAIPRS